MVTTSKRKLIHQSIFIRQEYYRSGNRGRIYNKYSNLKRTFKTAVGKHIEEPQITIGASTSKILRTFGKYIVLSFNIQYVIYIRKLLNDEGK